MKTYALDLRERGGPFVADGGTKAEAARRFAVGRMAQLDPEKLRTQV